MLVGLIAMCGVALADVLTPPDFTIAFMRALAQALPNAKVASKQDLQLTVSHADGRETTIELTNSYRDYAQDPARFDQLVRSFARATGQSGQSGNAAGLDRSRIVPVIKDRKWVEDLRKTLEARGTPQESLFEPFNNELVIVYAEDDPTRTR